MNVQIQGDEIAGLESIGGEITAGMIGAGRGLKDTLTGAVGRLYGNDRSLFKSAKDQIGIMFKVKPGHIPVSPIGADIANYLGNNNYMALGAVTVYAPRGLAVSYSKYIETLDEAVTVSNRVYAEIIGPVTAFFSVYVNNPAMLRGVSPRKVSSELLYQSIDPYGKRIGECFNANKTDTIKFSQAYSRNADVAAINLSMAALEVKANVPGVRKMEEGVLALVNVIEQFHRMCNTDVDFPEVQAAVIKDFSEIIRRTALWVEFYSVVQHQVMTMSAALTDTTKRLKEISKRK